MNSKQTPDSVELHERCFAYLIGEMTAQDAQQFEREFSDPKIADALSRESELILAASRHHEVAETTNTSMEANEQALSSPPVSVSHLEQTSRHSDTHRSSASFLVMLLSALAASMLLAIPLLFPPDTFSQHSDTFSQHSDDTPSNNDRTPDASYDLAVAIKWAKPAVRWDQTQDWSVDEQLMFDDATEDVSSDDPNEDSVDWMVVAVQATIPVSEENNDG